MINFTHTKLIAGLFFSSLCLLVIASDPDQKSPSAAASSMRVVDRDTALARIAPLRSCAHYGAGTASISPAINSQCKAENEKSTLLHELALAFEEILLEESLDNRNKTDIQATKDGK